MHRHMDIKFTLMIFHRIPPEIKKKSSDESRRENQITNFILNTFLCKNHVLEAITKYT
jgi:hypothetical protein